MSNRKSKIQTNIFIMETIYFKELYKGKAHARKRVVNDAYKIHNTIRLYDLSTKEFRDIPKAKAHDMLSHSVELPAKPGQDADTLLYFHWDLTINL